MTNAAQEAADQIRDRRILAGTLGQIAHDLTTPDDPEGEA